MDEAAPQRRRRRRAGSPQGQPRPSSATPPTGKTDAPTRTGDKPAASTPAPDDVPAPGNAPAPENGPSPKTAPAKPRTTGERKPRRGRARPGREESGMRDLVGGGQSQLGVSRALRARDVNRPTAEDLAAAEAETVVVRRNWRPDSEPHRG